MKTTRLPYRIDKITDTQKRLKEYTIRNIPDGWRILKHNERVEKGDKYRLKSTVFPDSWSTLNKPLFHIVKRTDKLLFIRKINA